MRPQKPTVLVVAESAQLTLIQMRDHLRLLSRLTETGTSQAPTTTCFAQIPLHGGSRDWHETCEEVLGGIRYDHEVASRHTTQPALNDRLVRSALRTPKESSSESPLIEATRKVMPQRGEFQIFFPKKFGTTHVPGGAPIGFRARSTSATPQTHPDERRSD